MRRNFQERWALLGTGGAKAGGAQNAEARRPSSDGSGSPLGSAESDNASSSSSSSWRLDTRIAGAAPALSWGAAAPPSATPQPLGNFADSTSELRMLSWVDSAKARLQQGPGGAKAVLTQLDEEHGARASHGGGATAPHPAGDGDLPPPLLAGSLLRTGSGASDGAVHGGAAGALLLPLSNKSSRGSSGPGANAGAPAGDKAAVADPLPADAPAAAAAALRRRRAAAAGPASRWLAAAYVLLNIASTCGIVFANKLVLSTFGFSFPVALTLLHALFTAAGMELMCRAGFFSRKAAPLRATAPVALAYVGSIVFSNMSIKFNTVGFYQVCKVLITPTLLAVEFAWLQKRPGRAALLSTAVLLAGISVATLLDKQVSSNPLGAAVGLASTLVSALYQILASKKQQDLGLDASQLLHQSMPAAAVLLAALVPAFEPVGLPAAANGFVWGAPGTLLGYQFTAPAVFAIVGSAALGLLVSLSAFLVIGSTSALTYNVSSHLKTVLIMAGGIAFFGDAANPSKLGGLALALAGIVLYSLHR